MPQPFSVEALKELFAAEAARHGGLPFERTPGAALPTDRAVYEISGAGTRDRGFNLGLWSFPLPRWTGTREATDGTKRIYREAFGGMAEFEMRPILA